MKENAKKNVFTTIESLVRRVTLSQAPLDSPFLYVVTDYSKKIRSVVSVKYFNDLREAENYLFENYVYMIIPTNRFLTEGSNIFLY